jgi:TP901 family phage tail tape measure protein
MSKDRVKSKLNEVDNNFAISTKDLSDGIRKAAASSKTFGVDINELTGYIAAIGRFSTAA